MKSIKKGLAVLLTALLLVPRLPAMAEESVPAGSGVAEEVSYNTGTHSILIATAPKEEAGDDQWEFIDPEPIITLDESGLEEEVSGNEAQGPEKDQVSGGDNPSEGEPSDPTTEPSSTPMADDYFQEDGSYTINIPEANPFFPYEVQFTCDGVVTNEWFMTPEDTVEVGGHTFCVSAYFDNTVVTSMSFDVAGQKVIVYPEEKEFTEDGGIALMSLLPLEEKWLTVDLTGFSPIDLTMVSVDSICLGAGIELAEPDKLIWSYSTGTDDYSISGSGQVINLSKSTSSNYMYLEMIVGEADQLAADNIRYIVNVNRTSSNGWLTPVIYKQSADGSRTNIPVVRTSYYDYDPMERELSITINSKDYSYEDDLQIGLSVNSSLFPNAGYASLKVYEGKAQTAADAMTKPEITAQILNTDLTQAGTGYPIERYYSAPITIVGFNAEGNVVGCLPLDLYFSSTSDGLSWPSIWGIENGSSFYPTDTSSSSLAEDGWLLYTYTLYSGYAANAIYYQELEYYENGSTSNEKVTAAYVGKYASIAEATAAGATEVKEQLFGNGYLADYSQGVYFTVFVGGDGTEDQKIYRIGMKTIEGENVRQDKSSSTYMYFDDLYDAEGNLVDGHVVEESDDTFGRMSNFVTMLVGQDVDLTSLAPSFYHDKSSTVYAAGGSEPEKSGETLHDFSRGPVQYTVSAENGEDSENYWLHVVKATEGAGWLYLNSLYAPEAEVSQDENGTLHTVREVVLDSYEGYTHDVLLANMGLEAIPNLSVELISDSVELDEYWTLTGNHELSGYDSNYHYTSYGELPNLAKLRIKAKEGVEKGTEVSGTLTIKSGDKALVVITLTGLIGDPSIVTKEIPHAVKYVPYGTMIQNSNRYDWNKVTYSRLDGSLPDGMRIKENGELYGVPMEAGEYTFTIRMDNSYSDFSSDEKTFTLIVDDNTDENVDGATDEGYELTERVQNMYLDSLPGTDQLLVSQGVLGEFVDLYLDGVLLVPEEDYFAESGSTRITIFTETLTSVGVGTHTLGMEFRTEEADLLKAAAQNYIVEEKNPDTSEGETGSGDTGTTGGETGSGDTGTTGSETEGGDTGNIGDNTGAEGGGNIAGGNVSGNSGNAGSVSPEVSKAASVTTTTLYTVQSGDSLWKIAKKFFGDGSYWHKIYEDNKEVLSNPDRIYKGQVLKIVLETAESVEGSESVSAEGNIYVVKKGDSLWKIAKKELGLGQLWRVIYDANKDIIADPKSIYAGQELIIPEEQQ